MDWLRVSYREMYKLLTQYVDRGSPSTSFRSGNASIPMCPIGTNSAREGIKMATPSLVALSIRASFSCVSTQWGICQLSIPCSSSSYRLQRSLLRHFVTALESRLPDNHEGETHVWKMQDVMMQPFSCIGHRWL